MPEALCLWSLTHYAKPGCTVRSSAPMNLAEQFALMKEFYDRGALVVRLHTNDPCIYGAIQEQMAFFDRHGMSYHITPGISSFQAAYCRAPLSIHHTGESADNNPDSRRGTHADARARTASQTRTVTEHNVHLSQRGYCRRRAEGTPYGISSGDPCRSML